MILVTFADYSAFKTGFSALGGSHKTTVVWRLVSASIFAVEAALLDVIATFNDNAGVKPSTFDADFPQAVQADTVSHGA